MGGAAGHFADGGHAAFLDEFTLGFVESAVGLGKLFAQEGLLLLVLEQKPWHTNLLQLELTIRHMVNFLHVLEMDVKLMEINQLLLGGIRLLMATYQLHLVFSVLQMGLPALYPVLKHRQIVPILLQWGI